MLWRVNVIVVPVTAKERSDSEPWAGHFKFKLNL